MKTSFPSLFLISLFVFGACAKDLVRTDKECSHVSSMTKSQAMDLAILFSSCYVDDPDSSPTKGVLQRSIKDVDVYVENDDTLMFSVNFEEDGFVLLGTSGYSFPVLAHASQGHFYFSSISEGHPMTVLLSEYKNGINESLRTNMQDCFWENLGKEGYELTVSVSDPSDSTKTKVRDYTTGKATIYPYTGIALDCWKQDGGYNYYAENGALIGCPAVAISMLLYDTSQRPTGSSMPTVPSFNYTDSYDVSGAVTGTPVAQKMRQVADCIPNYAWGNNPGSTSGALTEDIVEALRSLGFTHAAIAPFAFETVYGHMSYWNFDYFGNRVKYNRGTLIGGYQRNVYGKPTNGHIWFCDGYYELEYTMTEYYQGYPVRTWHMYDDRLYMNWGWGVNNGNGWYSATDEGLYWSSLDGQNVYLRFQPKMFVNLNYYETPQN